MGKKANKLFVCFITNNRFVLVLARHEKGARSVAKEYGHDISMMWGAVIPAPDHHKPESAINYQGREARVMKVVAQ